MGYGCWKEYINGFTSYTFFCRSAEKVRVHLASVSRKGIRQVMDITVLMATYRGKDYVRQQLDSILAQTVPVNILVSDDGSEDGTREILEEYQERYPDRITLRHHRTSHTEGGSAADNFFWLLSVAFHQDGGTCFLLSDQDDVWFPHKAEILLEEMKQLEARLGADHPVLVHSDMEVVGPRLEQISPSFFAYAHCDPTRVTLPEILVENPVTGGALMMNRALLNLVWTKPSVCYMHDWWIALTASCFGTIHCVRRPLYQYRQHDRNLVGATAIGSVGELAKRLHRQEEVGENYRRMLAQAAAFGRMFRDRLDREQKQVLEAFLALPGQTPSQRLASIVRNHFYKSSRLQTLAMCFTMPGGKKERKKAQAGDWDRKQKIAIRDSGLNSGPALRSDSGQAPGSDLEQNSKPVLKPDSERNSGLAPGPHSQSRQRLNCVILNYNDAATVENLVARLHDYRILEQIVVVDNHSTDDSLERLRLLEDGKVTVICAARNGGYGFGNNLGVRYAVTHNQATHVLIANPDISVSEGCLARLLRVFEKCPQAAMVTARMEDQQYGTLRNGWKLRGYGKELLSMGPVSRRLFGRFLDYPASWFQKKALYVEAVHGSMLMVDGARFLEAGGYDEHIFLYQEEAVLGCRMKACGYKSVLRLDCSYQHAHAASISRTFASQMGRQRLREESELYYMKQYLHIHPWQEVFARFWFWGIRMEIRVAEMMGLLAR